MPTSVEFLVRYLGPGGKVESRKVRANGKDDLLAQVGVQELPSGNYKPLEIWVVGTSVKVWSDALPQGWVETDEAIKIFE